MITITPAYGSTPVDSDAGAQKLQASLFRPAELALDPATWDLAIPVKILKGPDATVQRIKTRFRFFLGEWFLDTRLGVPYFQHVLIKNPDPILVSSIFRRVLQSTPGVRVVRSFKASLDRVTRTLTVDFLALLNDDTVVIAQAEPFIIEG